jgi:hypothetical protein
MEEKRCKLVEGKVVSPSSIGGVPCELCLVLANMSDNIAKLEDMVKSSNVMKDLKLAHSTYGALLKSHKRCSGCGMCFGGDHEAKPFKFAKEIGDICEWCAKELEQNGKQEFINRRKSEIKE